MNDATISKCITLSLDDGSKIEFYFTSFTNDKEAARGYISLTLSSDLGGSVYTSPKESVFVSDWYGLCDYLAKYIIPRQDMELEIASFEYLTYEFQYKLQAIGGYMETEEEGHLSLSFWIDVGKPPIPVSRKRIRLGIESSVQVSEVKRFIVELRTFLDESTRGDKAVE